MQGRHFFASAVALFLCVAPVSTAKAAPIFGLPDLNFAAIGGGRVAGSPSFPVEFNGTSFSMEIATSFGDQTSIDYGSGFTPTTTAILDAGTGGSVTPTGFIYTTNVTLQLGPGGTLSLGGPLILERSLTGFDGLAIMKVIASEGTPFTVGQTVGLDLHLFNVRYVHETPTVGFFSADVKGDLAPVVAEPSSMALLLAGLSALGGFVRRKITV
jgi:hypothetical protein